jgi:dihydroorotate dehydrogenase (fumarate)
MPDLSTEYLGLRLRTPIVASAGPLTARLESLKALQDAGVSAVVLPSLFEEQIAHDTLQAHELWELGADSNPEATGYVPELNRYESGVQRYLRLVQSAKDALDIPVIASLNGSTPGGWTAYAKLLEEAGADALELNVYRIVTDGWMDAAQVEREQAELVSTVHDSISIPLAVKVSPYFSAFTNVARGLIAAGADGLVLFNRFYQPDIDLHTLEVAPRLVLSTSEELRLPLRWIAILWGRVSASLAATTGVHTGKDVVKCLLAGADVVMMTSALLLHGPEHVRSVERELTEWIVEGDYRSVSQLKGSVSQQNVADPSSFERANYIGTLVRYANSFHTAQSWGPW